MSTMAAARTSTNCTAGEVSRSFKSAGSPLPPPDPDSDPGCYQTGATAGRRTGAKRTGLYQLIQNGFNPKRSSDVIIQLQSGWISWSTKTGTSHGSAYRYDTHVPLIFYGKNIPQGTTHEQVSVMDIAPTICTLLNIEFPSGSIGKPLKEVLK